MKLKKIRIEFLLIKCLFLFLGAYGAAANARDFSKIRLPEQINSFQDAILPVISLDGDIFFFDRKFHPSNIGGLRDPDDIWFSRQVNGNWGEPVNLGTPWNSPGTDVFFSIAPDGNSALVYLSDSSFHDIGAPGFAIVSIENGILSNPRFLKINDYQNSSPNFYAYLSHNGKTLLLSVECKDGFGELDLFVSFLQPDGSWSKPKNLGNTVNTNAAECAPFLAPDGITLYFSSNGHGGEGRLDLFLTRRLDDSWEKWSEPINLGADINTRFDESSLSLSALADTLYFVSADLNKRKPGIYIAPLPAEFRPYPYMIVSGSIFESDGKPSRRLVTITIEDNQTKEIRKLETDKTNYLFVLESNKSFNIRFSLGDEIIWDKVIDTRKLSAPSHQKYDIQIPENQGFGFVESAEPDVIQPIGVIFFDTAKDLLSQEAEIELKSIVAQLKESSNLKLLIVGHADRRGADQYNYELSLRRAQRTAEFLRFYGIKPSLIEVDAKGKTNPCCEVLDKNRRVELYLMRD